jgi:hypothetical protein
MAAQRRFAPNQVRAAVDALLLPQFSKWTCDYDDWAEATIDSPAGPVEVVRVSLYLGTAGPLQLHMACDEIDALLNAMVTGGPARPRRLALTR